MRGSRFSHSRPSPTKDMRCASEDQRAGFLWPGAVTFSSLSSRMMSAATTSFRSKLHLSGPLVSNLILPCSVARRWLALSSTLPLTMILARSFQPLHSLRPPPRCLRRPASGCSPTSRWALRLMLKTLTRTRMARHALSAHCSRMPLWPSTFSEFMRSLVTLISSAFSSSSVLVK
jgi:hypothetical protein